MTNVYTAYPDDSLSVKTLIIYMYTQLISSSYVCVVNIKLKYNFVETPRNFVETPRNFISELYIYGRLTPAQKV